MDGCDKFGTKPQVVRSKCGWRSAQDRVYVRLPAMRVVLLLVGSLTCVTLCRAGSKNTNYQYSSQYPRQAPPSAYEGSPCELPEGYLPYTCEAGELLHSSSEILPVEAHG